MSGLPPGRKRNVFLEFTRRTPFTVLFPNAFMTLGLSTLLLGTTLLLNALPGVDDWVSIIPASFFYIHMVVVILVATFEVATRASKFAGQTGLRVGLGMAVAYFMIVSAHGLMYLAIARAQLGSFDTIGRDQYPPQRWFRAFFLAVDVMAGLGTGSVVALSDLAIFFVGLNAIAQNFSLIFLLENILMVALK